MRKDYLHTKSKKTIYFCKIILFFITLGITTDSWSQANNCADTNPTLTVGLVCNTTGFDMPNNTFNNSGVALSCAGTSYRDGWYIFTTDAATSLITIQGTSNRNLGLALYTGACGSLTPVAGACTIPNTANASLTNITVTPNTTYRLRVMRTNTGTNSFQGTICVYKSNDNCINAISLTVNPSPDCAVSTDGTTVGATLSQTGCSGTADDDVWYSFTAISTTQTVTVNRITLNNPIFQIFSGTCGSLTSIACVNDNTGNNSNESRTFTGLTIGDTYYVRVYSSANNVFGTFNICITSPNDNCSDAVSLTVNPTENCTTSTTGTTIGATQSQTGCTGNADDDVWYRFVATNNSHIITLTHTSGWSLRNGVFQVFSGSCGSLSGLGCINNDSNNNGIETTTLTGLTIGNTYFVRVYSNGGNGDRGTFSICITTPNDNCPAAIPLTVNPTPVCTTSTSGTTVGATQSSPTTGSCANNNSNEDDVWYNFTATGTSHTVTVTRTTLINPVFEIFSGNCGSLNLIECVNDFSTNTAESRTFTGLTAGNIYFVRVYSFANGSGRGTFNICITTPVVNDECSGAIALTVNTTATCTSSYNGTTVNATQSLPAAGTCVGANAIDDDIWFSFVALNASHVITLTRTSNFNLAFEVFTGTCGSLTRIACINDTGDNANEFTNLSGLTIGNTYYVRVYSAGSTRGTFNICITSCSGTGIGNSTAACLDVLAGGLTLNGANPAPVNLCNGLPSVNLEAQFTPLGNTNSYTVNTIPYANLPYQYGCLANTINISIDDRWSNSINIPFSSGFCFYGNTYYSFVIGTNGMISFNDALANGATGYYIGDINNNIPTNVNASNGGTNYFYGPSIFGVHHDINPAVGGEMGWEMITLETGCRALVIAWSNVPMYWTSSRLYTGMIVLYENTGIVEVYIREKRLDPYIFGAYWNNGNAVVGLQNNSTQGIAAPGRNATDGNPGWEVTNEAWRFTPSGTSIASTVTWYEGSGTSGSVVGTGNTIAVSPAETTTYTAAVTYSFCNGATSTITDETTVTVTGGKVWNGSDNADWDNTDNWTPTALPTASDCVIIPNTPNQPVISGTNYNGLAGTLRILNNATLTINSENNLTVTDWVNVSTGGTFIVENDANLVQINDVANTVATNGNFIYQREAEVRTSDYVYWSSPVKNQSLSSIFTPISAGPRYVWDTKISNPNGGQGNWVSPGSSPMIDAKGYIIRGPNTSPFNNATTNPLTANFKGIPNNGTITIPIHRGSDQNTNYHEGTNGEEITNLSDNWNLVGNPYPSSIRASQFLLDNSTKILGNVQLWMHGILPSSSIANPFYSTFGANYDAENDYLTFTFTGSDCCPDAEDDLFIGAGQGFFVQMIDGAQTTDNSNFITFNNGMRKDALNNPYSNTTFFRTNNNYVATPPTQESSFNISEIERHRIWLDIVRNGKSNRTLFGYIEGATMGNDSFYDCVTQSSGAMTIYSLVDDKKFNIQGRALPFSNNDVVSIGIVLPNSGNYTIAVAGVDGIFSTTQEFYLKDNVLNIIHDIKANPYHFTSAAGMYNDRFEIVYQTGALDNNDFEKSNIIKVITNENLTVVARNQTMESIIVYNVLGQNIGAFNEINAEQITLQSLPKNNTTLLLKIKLQSGETVIRKVIY